MLWEESRNKGNIHMCLPRLRIYVTQGLDLEVAVFVFREPIQTQCTVEFHSTMENSHLSSSRCLMWRAGRHAMSCNVLEALICCHLASPCDMNWSQAALNTSQTKCHF